MVDCNKQDFDNVDIKTTSIAASFACRPPAKLNLIQVFRAHLAAVQFGVGDWMVRGEGSCGGMGWDGIGWGGVGWDGARL